MSNNEANLITKSEGTIYHLHLTPEDICPVVITVGDPDRVSIVAAHLDYKEKEVAHREFHSVVGRLGSKKILVISTGIGPDNIDIVMTELHILYTKAVKRGYLSKNGLKFIRLGTSGSVHKAYPIDSILITRQSIGVDNLPTFYQRVSGVLVENRVEIPYYLIEPKNSMFTHFLDLPSSKTGTTLTCPGFYGPQGRNVHLPPRRNMAQITNFFIDRGINIANIEMETAALYYFATAFGHLAISINALIAHRLTNQFSEQAGLTVRNMIADSMKLLRNSPD